MQTNVTITGFRNEGLQYVFEVRAMDWSYESSGSVHGIQWNFVAINYTGMYDLYVRLCLVGRKAKANLMDKINH